MEILTARARAYVNHGRWVADCPTGCGSALELQKGQAMYHCDECMHLSSVEWPSNPQEIWDTLLKRKLPRTRNWYPRDHYIAVRAGQPHGQTVDDLRAETDANESSGNIEVF